VVYAFRGGHLEDWAELHARVIALVDGLAVKPAN
jgi:hypothetical protein